ncbi:uncharacterized protein [Anabrus simplex]|uniref:uncharacterized protein n=1 Tax=Anabrus simplex TaxID=316456 RepID=UPI0035A33B39
MVDILKSVLSCKFGYHDEEVPIEAYSGKNAFQPSDNPVKIKEDPHAAIADLSLEYVDLDVVKELCSDEEENAVQSSDNQAKIKADPHAEIADLSLEEVDLNVVKELCSDEPSADVKDETFDEQIPCLADNNVEDFAVLTDGSLQSPDGSSQAFKQAPLPCELLTQPEEQAHCSSVGGSIFAQECYVKRHSVSSGVKSYHCNVCNRTFSNKYYRNYHLLIHSKPYRCNVCDKTFARKYRLREHLQTHASDNAFCCNICGKKFECKRYLTKHSSVHSGKRPFECNVCSKDFRTKHCLTKHVATHSLIRSYQCELCQKSFTECLKLVGVDGLRSAELSPISNLSRKKRYTFASLACSTYYLMHFPYFFSYLLAKLLLFLESGEQTGYEGISLSIDDTWSTTRCSSHNVETMLSRSLKISHKKQCLH